MGTQEAIGQGLVFAQQTEQEVFGLNIRRAELAGFVACEKDDAPGFLRITFKHDALPLAFLVGTLYPPDPLKNLLGPNSSSIMQSKGQESQQQKRYSTL